MALRLSTALRNHVNKSGSMAQALKGGVIEIYTGQQPVSADDAVIGTLLVTVTLSSASHTNETRSAGTVQLTGGASGSVDSITVGGVELLENAVSFNTSLNQTATNVATEINRSTNPMGLTASATTDTVTIESPVGGQAADFNTMVVASTASTITTTDVNMASGVSAVNGLGFDNSSAGVLSKASGETWTGTAAASGTAGWFRFKGSQTDDGTADSSAEDIRLDGNISTSGAELNLSSLTITASATQTLTSFDITLPAS
jgi:hypothetical protein